MSCTSYGVSASVLLPSVVCEPPRVPVPTSVAACGNRQWSQPAIVWLGVIPEQSEEGSTTCSLGSLSAKTTLLESRLTLLGRWHAAAYLCEGELLFLVLERCVSKRYSAFP